MKPFLYFLIFFYTLNLFAQQPKIIFRSGFESNSQIQLEQGQVSRLINQDNSFFPPNNWSVNPYINDYTYYFKIINGGGDISMRKSEITNDPENPNNNVLHFLINEPNGGPNYGRVQANMISESYDNAEGSKKLAYSVRLFIPQDLSPLKEFDYSIDWFQFMEFWNNLNRFDNPYPFRVNLKLKKDAETTDLNFILKAETYVTTASGRTGFANIWSKQNDYRIPLEKWLTFSVFFKEGDNNTGKVKIEITPQGEDTFTLFDVTNYTHHPNDPSPNGIQVFNPLKLYTSSEVINYVNDNGGLTHLYWDDFILCSDKGVDLIIRKSIDDIKLNSGNNSGTIYWDSPDIWVRNQSDGFSNQEHQIPVYNPNKPVYVYVRVTNNSCTTFTPSEEDTLMLHWTKANSISFWPNLWNDSLTHSMLMGDILNEKSLPSIAPGESKIIEFIWQLPNSYKYDKITDTWNFSLLARILSPKDPMIFSENLGHDKAFQNNNIASKNLIMNNP